MALCSVDRYRAFFCPALSSTPEDCCFDTSDLKKAKALLDELS
jgi:hypothetical protein